MGRLTVIARLAFAAVLVSASAAAQPSDTRPRAPDEPASTPTPATPATPASDPEPPPDVPSAPDAPPIPPKPGAGTEPAPGAPSDPSTNEADKRIGIGVDALFVLPVGAYAEGTGPLGGPLMRFGYRVLPLLELTLRAGYVFATSKTHNGVVTKMDLLPLVLGARVFFWKPFLGPYVTLEGGMVTILPTVDRPPAIANGEKHTELRRRGGALLGAGYLLSEHLPIDLRFQVLLLNLIGQQDALSEKLNIGLGLSAGYTLQF